MLTNNGLCLCTAVQYVLFLVLMVNSTRFRIYVVTRSYSSHTLSALVGTKGPQTESSKQIAGCT